MGTSRRPPPGGTSDPPSLSPDLEGIAREVMPIVAGMAKRADLTRAEQEDVVQDVFLAVMTRLHTHDPRLGTRRMWVCGIARHKIADVWRRRTWETPSDRMIEAAEATGTPEQVAHAREALQLINDALRENCREVFLLHADGLTAIEIGELLGMPQSTVELRLKEARRDIERVLGGISEKDRRNTGECCLLLPFATVDDVIAALRELPGLSEQRIRELLERARSRHDSGAEADPTSPPPSRKPPSDAPPDGSQGPRSMGPLRPWLVPHLNPGTLLLAAAGVLVPNGLATGNDGRAAPPFAIAAEARTTVLAASPVPLPLAMPSPAMGPAGKKTTPHVKAPSSSAGACQPDDDVLLQRALAALASSPELALALARQHGDTFPKQSVQRRKAIVARALAALGRPVPAEAGAATEPGSIYETDRREIVPQ
jgi:RNA polymerase sigma-70 factor (ECF subfamily)